LLAATSGIVVIWRDDAGGGVACDNAELRNCRELKSNEAYGDLMGSVLAIA